MGFYRLRNKLQRIREAKQQGFTRFNSNTFKYFLMKKIALLLIYFLHSVVIYSQNQGWKKILAADSLLVGATCSDNKGGYFIFGQYHCVNTISCHRLINIDANGNKKWSRDYPDFRPTNYGGLTMIQSLDGLPLLYGHIAPDPLEQTSLVKLDENGNVLWRKELPVIFAGIKTTKTEIIVHGPSRIIGGNPIFKLDNNGNTISQTYAQATVEGSIIEYDGLTGYNGFSETVFRVDFNGQLKWSYKIDRAMLFSGGYFQITKTKDSSYIMTNLNKMIKLDNKGNFLWKKELVIPIARQFLDDDGGLICISDIKTYNNGIFKTGLFKLNKNGDLLWSREYETQGETTLLNVIKIQSGGYFICGGITFFKVLILKVNEEGFIYSNFLQGKVTNDFDKNCILSTNDQPCKNCMVEANNNEIYRSSTNELGNYFMNLDSGNYTIKAYPLTSSSYWQSCTPLVSTALKTNKTNDTLNFFIKPLIISPVMVVNTSAPFLRRCVPNFYSVKYCNRGTTQADSVYVDIILDSLLEYMSSTRPFISKVGRKYRFNLGKVEVDECGNFELVARVRCGDSTRLGQTICIDTQVFPDKVVTLNSLWSGANLEVTGTCQKDSVIFQVKNTGRAASSRLDAFVIENDIFRYKKSIQLPVNGIFTEKIKSTGNTWRMTVNQEPNHPTSINPTAFIEGCGDNGLSLRSSGYAVQFANDDKALSVDTDCQPIIGSFDPNDKIGYPIGYGKPHYIPQNEDIEYRIRFQNTGTDTAFTVVIRDTITEKLDISTIEYGVSSHPFKAEIYGKGIVKFTFDNIDLVDSFKNAPKSHGFVKFRIRQKKDLPFGTKIENHAGIYFDFNQPVLTDTTLHTVGVKEVISAVVEKSETTVVVKVSPNPFTEKTRFELPPLSISTDFELFDMTGKVLRKEKIAGNTFDFHRKGLAMGIYIFKISTDGKPWSVGKFVIQ